MNSIKDESILTQNINNNFWKNFFDTYSDSITE